HGNPQDFAPSGCHHVQMGQSQRQSATAIGGVGEHLSDQRVTGFILEQLAGQPLDGRSVCVLVPDATRSCPLPLLITAVHQALRYRVSRLTVLVALGTHAPMTEEELRYPGMTIQNHEWWKPEVLTTVGT